MSSILTFDNVTKRFGSQVALDQFNLALGAGTICALLGDNGAGKTTSLRILLGLLQADAGTTQVLGLDGKNYGVEIRRRVGYMPERPALYEWMTVAETGWFTAGFYPPGFGDRFKALCERYQLPPGKKIKELSKGMRAKVVFALALASDPQVLILDEPTSGLDPVVRREILESMSEYAAEGKTILLSSHQLHEVERIADRVVILRQGKKVLDEPLDGLKENVTEMTVTFADRTATILDLPGVLFQQHDPNRQSRFLCRDLDDLLVTRVRQTAQVRDVTTRRLNLEELYFSMMKP